MLHASINLPAAAQQLRQDARLRKFENLTQSTSNSNFPFESNTLKRVPLVSTKDDYANVSHTQSCINLKSSGAPSGSGALNYGSPQHMREIINESDQNDPRSFMPMNQDTLQTTGTRALGGHILLSVCDEMEPSSACLTPVSGMDLDLDLSMVANKGSMTLSVDVSKYL